MTRGFHRACDWKDTHTHIWQISDAHKAKFFFDKFILIAPCFSVQSSTGEGTGASAARPAKRARSEEKKREEPEIVFYHYEEELFDAVAEVSFLVPMSARGEADDEARAMPAQPGRQEYRKVILVDASVLDTAAVHMGHLVRDAGVTKR